MPTADDLPTILACSVPGTSTFDGILSGIAVDKPAQVTIYRADESRQGPLLKGLVTPGLGWHAGEIQGRLRIEVRGLEWQG